MSPSASLLIKPRSNNSNQTRRSLGHEATDISQQHCEAVADSVRRLINLGKYGSFHSNQILGRPYHLTFEILDKSEVKDDRELRIVSAAELHATELLEEAEGEEGSTPSTEADEYGLMTGMKSNANITDDPTTQRLTMAEIEALKQDEMGSTKDLIAKIMNSHSKLDQKTAFSLAKYTLKKHKKYMKRFTVVPMDVATLTDWMMAERDFSKVMEIRNETIGLIGCWANVHAAGNRLPEVHPSSRYLVIDDTGGLLLAAMAERMGILHQSEPETEPPGSDEEEDDQANGASIPAPHRPKRQSYLTAQMSAPSNTLTLIHSNQQPNLSLLRYFNFDSNNPTPSHPLYSHLKTLSWLQLLDPQSDSAYQEPPVISPEELATLKSNRRSNYFRKRRRWERTKSVIDETRHGGFNGLIVASYTSPISILHHLVPLLSGGSQVVVYCPHIEPLTELADAYSTARRTAFLNTPEDRRDVPSEHFPVDPTLLLVPAVQTSRVRKWQVLPGRTHPLMMGRGGSEGYVFVGTRVVPAEGRVSARGRAGRGKKVRVESEVVLGNGEEQDRKRLKLDGDGKVVEDEDVVMDENLTRFRSMSPEVEGAAEGGSNANAL